MEDYTFFDWLQDEGLISKDITDERYEYLMPGLWDVWEDQYRGFCKQNELCFEDLNLFI